MSEHVLNRPITKSERLQSPARWTNSLLSEEFTAAVKAAVARAREETLKSGIAIFYRDGETGVDVMEYANGRRFQIRFIAGAPRDRNYQVLREFPSTAP